MDFMILSWNSVIKFNSEKKNIKSLSLSTEETLKNELKFVQNEILAKTILSEHMCLLRMVHHIQIQASTPQTWIIS